MVVLREFTEGKFKKYTEGDSLLPGVYQDYRVIGTTPDMFTLTPPGGQGYSCASGEIFRSDDFFTAVIGSRAWRTGLTVSSTFQPTRRLRTYLADPFKVGTAF